MTTTRTADLSELQRALYFLHRRCKADPSYNVGLAMRLRSQIEESRLRQMLDRLAARHPSLRTRARSTPSGLRGELLEPGAFPLKIVSGRTDPGSLRSRLEIPFDLDAEPPARAHLVTNDAEERVLLIVAHHIAVDFESLMTLYRELPSAYAGALDSLPPEDDRPDGTPERREASWSHWRRITPEPPYPIPPPSRRGPREWLPFELPLDSARKLIALARSLRSTPFVLLATLYAAATREIHGGDLVTIGSPFSLRTSRRDTRVGNYANPLPLQIEIGRATCFRDACAEMKSRVFAALEHRFLPCSEIVRRHRMEGRCRDGELVRSMFSFHALPDPTIEGALPLEPIIVPQQVGQFPLALETWRRGDCIGGAFKVDGERFDPDEGRRLPERFLESLERALRDPTRPVRAASVPRAPRPGRSVREPRTPPLPFENGIAGWIASQARDDPDGLALVFREQRVSRGALNRRANRVAHALVSAGVGVGDRVAVYCDRSPELVVATLAALKAGAIFVPLDVDLPIALVRELIRDADPSVVLTQRRHMKLEPIDRGWAVDEAERWRTFSSDDPDRRVLGSSPAYLIHTSGSTGRPKGVVNTHAGIANRLRWMQKRYRLRQADRVLHKTPISFDVSIWELLWPLMTRAALVVAEPGGHRDPGYLARLVEEQSVSLLHFVPSVLSRFLTDEGAARCDLSTVRQLICSGEALLPDLVRRTFERFAAADLDNLYGPTEAAIDVTAWRCDRREMPERIPIGWPIDNVECLVLDAALEPCPVGVVGDLYLAGVALADGYWRQPEKTRSAFVPHPLATSPGARAYRTGDLASWRDDGALEFHGRSDDQLKVNGVRIEPQYVEARLGELRGIQRAGVTAVATPRGQELVAYFVPSTKPAPKPGEIRAQLRRRIPDAMVPSRFVSVDELPSSPSGKLRRDALTSLALPARPPVAPRNDLERNLLDLFERVLEVRPNGIHDDFFALGGDSMHSLRLLALAEAGGISFVLEDLFSNPTVAGLAACVVQSPPIQREPTSVPPSEPETLALPDDAIDAYPLLRLQAGMLPHQAWDPESTLYHDVVRLRIPLSLHRGRMLEALRGLAGYDAVRTGFSLGSEGRPVQWIRDSVDLRLEGDESDPLDAVARETAAEAWFEREKRRPFDLAAPPLIRFAAHRIDEEAFWLTAGFHHAILDGWSVSSLLVELIDRYRGRPVAERPVGAMRECVQREQAVLRDASAKSFWERELAGAPVVGEYTLRPDSHEAELEIDLPVDISDRLASVSEAGVTQKSVMIAAQLRILSHLTDGSAAVTGLVFDVRPEGPRSDRAVGLFLNTLPLWLELDDEDHRGESWIALARRCQDKERDLHRHRRVPLAQLSPRGRLPFFAAMNVSHFHAYREAPELVAASEDGFRFFERTSIPLMIHFDRKPSDGRLRIRLVGRGRFGELPVLHQLGRGLERALREATAFPEAAHRRFAWRLAAPPAAESDLPGDPGRERPDAGIVPELCAIVGRILGVGAVGPDDDFFDLGGDSLMLAQLAARLREEHRFDLSLPAFLNRPTPAGLAGQLRRVAPKPAVRIASAPTPAAPQRATRVREKEGGVLLTGATGLLGSAVLQRLLEADHRPISCLVRRGSSGDPGSRLLRLLRDRGVGDGHLERVRVLEGDLEAPLLGLERPAFEQLADTTTHVIHAGARVGLTTPYRLLRASHVGATGELARLASIGGAHLCFVSSLSVFDAPRFECGAPVTEETEPGTHEELDSDYARSKRAAETIVRGAASEGCPVSIVRPGLVLPEPGTRASSYDDFVWRVIRGCAALGVAPARFRTVASVPLRFAAAAIATRIAASSDPSSLRILHLAHERRPDWDLVLSALALQVPGLEVVDYPTWREEALHHGLGIPAFAPVLSALPVDTPRAGPEFDLSRSREDLARFALHCPPVDGAFVARCVAEAVSGDLRRPVAAIRSTPPGTAASPLSG